MNTIGKRTALAAAAVAAICSTTAIAAEGGVPEALGRVNTTLNSLIARVSQLSTKIDQLVAPQPSSSVLYTAPLRLGQPIPVGCFVTNTGPTPANVTITWANGSGAAEFAVGPALVPPQHTHTNTNTFLSPPLVMYCKFEADVPAAQLRAHMVMHYPDGAAVAEAK